MIEPREIPRFFADLRLSILEPGLSDLYNGAPDLLAHVEDLLSTLEVVCLQGDEDERWSRLRLGPKS
jgi:hypothetical protein